MSELSATVDLYRASSRHDVVGVDDVNDDDNDDGNDNNDGVVPTATT